MHHAQTMRRFVWSFWLCKQVTANFTNVADEKVKYTSITTFLKIKIKKCYEDFTYSATCL